MKRALILITGLLLISVAVGTAHAQGEAAWGGPGMPRPEDYPPLNFGVGGSNYAPLYVPDSMPDTAVRAPRARPTVPPAAPQLYDSREGKPALDPSPQTTPPVVKQRRTDSTQPQTNRRHPPDKATSGDTEEKAAVEKSKKKPEVPATTSSEEEAKPESQRAKPGELDVRPAEPKSKLQ